MKDMDSILNYKKCEEDDFYKLLGCDETSSIEQILAEYKNICLQCHPDKNLEDENSVAKFQKIQKAKEYLTDPEKRAQYDKWRNSGFSISFEQFLNLSKGCHTSMHWASKKQKDLMLEDDSCSSASYDNEEICRSNCLEEEINSSPAHKNWKRDPCNEVLRKFRNYEI